MFKLHNRPILFLTSFYKSCSMLPLSNVLDGSFRLAEIHCGNAMGHCTAVEIENFLSVHKHSGLPQVAAYSAASVNRSLLSN